MYSTPTQSEMSCGWHCSSCASLTLTLTPQVLAHACDWVCMQLVVLCCFRLNALEQGALVHTLATRPLSETGTAVYMHKAGGTLGCQSTAAPTFELLGASSDCDEVARVKLGIHCASEGYPQ